MPARGAGRREWRGSWSPGIGRLARARDASVHQFVLTIDYLCWLTVNAAGCGFAGWMREIHPSGDEYSLIAIHASSRRAQSAPCNLLRRSSTLTVSAVGISH